MLGDFVNFCGSRFLKYFLFVYGGILSFPKGRGVPRPGAGCLRRVTFVNSDKSNQKRHSRGKGFRFPFPLENPPSLKRPKGRGCDPSPLETSPRGVAIIKSRLFRSAAKVGGGQGPPEAKRKTDSHASDVGHWLGMTPLRGVRGDAPQGYLLRGERWAAFTQGRLDATALPWHTGRCGHRPLRKDKRCDGKMDGGRDTPRVLTSLRGHRPLRKVYRGWVRLICKRKRRAGASFCIFFLPFTFCVDRVELR